MRHHFLSPTFLLGKKQRAVTTTIPRVQADITPTLPYIVMGVAAIIDWIVFQTVFPETKGTNLINRIPDKKEKNLLSRKQSIVEA